MLNAMIFCTFNSAFGGALQYCLDIPYNEHKIKPHHLIFNYHGILGKRDSEVVNALFVRNEGRTMLKGKTVDKSSPLFKV